jgi:hypothetical protein
MLNEYQLSKLYKIDPIDYESDEMGVSRLRGDWLLVASGSGIMMAVMDMEPRFRWCIDIDGIKDPRARLADWLIGMEYWTGRICAVGGWALSDPAPLALALRSLVRPVTIYPITVQNPGVFDGLEIATSLDNFFDRLNVCSDHHQPLKLEAW